MNIKENLNDTLNGGFPGLFGEVVTEDIYRLRQIEWKPDIIFDLGANVGTFSRFARSLFPDALIIAIEPHEENYIHFKKFTDDKSIIIHNVAIGTGNIFRTKGAANGAGEVYLSEMTGYSKEGFKDENAFIKTGLEFTNVEQLAKKYLKHGMKSIVKIDIEGAENSIFEHEPSMKVLRSMDYVTMEIHRYALTGDEQPDVNDLTEKALKSFEATHDCEYVHPMFYATLKKQ